MKSHGTSASFCYVRRSSIRVLSLDLLAAAAVLMVTHGSSPLGGHHEMSLWVVPL